MESGNYQVTVTNNCPNRIWFRFYDNDNSHLGYDIAPNETVNLNTEKQFVRIEGFLWEKGEAEIWKPTFKIALEIIEGNYNHRVNLTNIFGPRTTQSIKVFVACMAGPADPLERNDIELVKKFDSIGVPPENIFLLLEKQCTPKTIQVNLENIVESLNEGDILFLYVGGHGSNHKGFYELCTWGGYTNSHLIMSCLKNCKSEVFLIIDSCFSGLMIEDVKNCKFSLKNNLHLLSSTHHDLPAWTGWKLIKMLIENIFINDYSDAKTIGNFISKYFSTSNPQQKANFHSL